MAELGRKSKRGGMRGNEREVVRPEVRRQERVAGPGQPVQPGLRQGQGQGAWRNCFGAKFSVCVHLG